MKEFDSEVFSTWLVCEKVRAEASTHGHLGKDRKEVLSQPDCINRTDEKKRRSLHPQCRKTMSHLGALLLERDSEEYLSVTQKNIDNAAKKIKDRMNAPMRK